jgi:transcription elongation factor Elf1
MPAANMHSLSRIVGAAKRLLPPKVAADGLQRVAFKCNVCGARNESVPRLEAENREFPSCRSCGSS